jgi:glycosyltransferase involved in cell wall biosynthesis
MTKIPFLLVGDGPQELTGLGRIARDLAGHLVQSDLPLDLVQIGGTVPPPWLSWRHFPLNPENDDWGASQVQRYWQDLWGSQPGILFVVWDPGRLYAYHDLDIPARKWAYTAIDGANVHGTISGPAGAAIQSFDRVLAYGRWASTVLAPLRRPMPYLPHGLHLSTFSKALDVEDDATVERLIGPHRGQDDLLIGCVATNQPRKDLSVFFGVLDTLRARGRKVYGWLHTDVAVKAWSISQLVQDFNVAKRVTVTTQLTEHDLALLYRACDLTIAPGLGEGFGYPIVESLAAGVPVVHGDHAGGVELIPRREWRPPVREKRFESVYAIVRPVYRIEDFTNAAERILDWRDSLGLDTVEAYCRGSVGHLGWEQLWPRWRQWVQEGL